MNDNQSNQYSRTIKYLHHNNHCNHRNHQSWWFWWLWSWWLLFWTKLPSIFHDNKHKHNHSHQIYSLHHHHWSKSCTIKSSLTLLNAIKFETNVITTLMIMIIICLPPIVHCEEECLRSKVLCYECESINNPDCSDPFNISYDKNIMKMCEGCCVKIVLDKNTSQKNIWRTCTSNLQINLFMVDHVCMEESNGQGHMCFCESDGCNHSLSSINYNSINYKFVLFISISFLLLETIITRTLLSTS